MSQTDFFGWSATLPEGFVYHREFITAAEESALGHARMRLRRYPHRTGERAALTLDLEPRSAYAMRGAARWRWQHAISPTRELRYSITFRTLAAS